MPGILVYLGLHIVRREVIFVDLALAQVASLGACVSLLLGHEAADPRTYIWSFGFTLVGAAIFALTRMRNHSRVPQEALIGITYVVAAAEGLAVRWWDFLFYALFGLVVTSFVQIGGVLLVFSYLIVPAVCANLLASRVAVLLALGWGIATGSGVLGLYTAYRFDLPTGAAIICVLGAALLLCGLAAVFLKKKAF